MTAERQMFCPVRRQPCDHAEVCWLITCARAGMRAKVRPVAEDALQLTAAEKYALHMAGKLGR